MTYIIAAADQSSGEKLAKLLEGDITLIPQGCFTTYKAAAACIRERPPDIAFIWLNAAELNAFRLARELRNISPRSKVIFVGSRKENAVEAFECEADGFILFPCDKRKIDRLLQQITV